MTKSVMIFGTFDGIHDGHRAFFREARTHGDHVTAVVARDATVERTKGRLPIHDESMRRDRLSQESCIDLAVLGTGKEDKTAVIREVAPDVIVLGYDQEHFISMLDAFLLTYEKDISIVRAGAHDPHIHKSSLINNHAHR